MITKELFVSTIESIREQIIRDQDYSFLISKTFNVEEPPLYDNSLIIKSLVELLRIWFPKDEDGHCAIEHYCFELNFGKNGDEYESIEDFYNTLFILKKHGAFSLKMDMELFNGLDHKISCDNTTKDSFKGKKMPYLMDEAGQFPSSDTMEPIKNYWDIVKKTKPSPHGNQKLLQPLDYELTYDPELTKKLHEKFGKMSIEEFKNYISNTSPDEN